MLSLLLGVLVAVAAPDSTENLEACLSKGPERTRPPITTLSGAQQTWLKQSVPRDTLQRHLSRILRARKCFLRLNPARTERPYLENIMETYNAEAELRASLRQFPKAFEAYQAGLSFLRSHSSDDFRGYQDTRNDWLTPLHQNQGYLHYLLGNLATSIEHYLRAFHAAPASEDQIELLLNVGILHQRTQDYRSARNYYQRAQDRLRNSGLPPDEKNDLQSFALQVEADLLLEQTLNADFSRDSLRQVRNKLRRGRALATPGAERYARLTSLLSESLGYLGAFEAARRLNEEVRHYARVHEEARFRTLALLKLGVLHMQTEHWDQADSTLHEALSRAEEFRDLDYQRRILRDLGRLHEMQGEWSKAERLYRQGVTVIEKYRESLTATQWSSTAFAQWRDVHRGLVRTLLAQDRPRKALTALDRSRARHLQDLRTQARVANQLPPKARTRLDSLSRALSEIRSQLGTKALTEAQATRLRTRETALMTARRGLLQLDSTVTARPSIEAVSSRLARQDRALVSYFLDDPWSIYDRTPRSAAFVLTDDTLRTVPLPGLTQDSVQAKVGAISSLFTTRQKPKQIGAMQYNIQPLRRLHDQLYAPIDEHLAPGQPLTVIPDGPLFHVPFSMLASETPGGRYDHRQARYVLHERATTLELATSMAGDTAATGFPPSPSAPDLAAFGVSTFDTLQTIPSALRATLPEAAAQPPFTLPPLPGVRSELNVLTDVIGDVKTFLDDKATEPAFARACRRAGVVHLASHAFVHPSSPLQNAFLLHPDSTSDGILFLHELQAQDRPLPLAVLSGCSTARGTLRGGEGMAGLQYAFRAMGAQATIANLWPTADRPSVTLMKTFYRHLQSGLPKDRALRQAKLTYLEAHPTQASPFFWGPAVLYGSPQPVPLSSSGGLLSWLWSPLATTFLIVFTCGGLWIVFRPDLPPWKFLTRG